MYTKTGLGLLAAAGLTFGVIGMQNGGASPASPACASLSTSGNAATGSAGASANAGHPTTRSTEPSGSNHGNGSGGTTSQGLASVDTSGVPGGGAGTVTVPNPNGGATAGGSGTSDTFLDLGGGTSGTALPGGQSAPPANTGLVGRSSYLAQLLQLNANADAQR
jgi:hypothetical protein